jgi:F0F1-type ATP synthase membrane subunit c/vacuolar-type H+-ATPase subunit K
MTATNQPLGSEHHYTDEEMHNEAVAHEHGDVNFRTVLAFGAAILVVVAISSGLMYGLFVAFEKQAKARDPEVSPYAVTNDTPPRGPQLLTNEPKYLREFGEEERGKLESYGWVNQGQALAHVPIDLAKKLVVQHGLPVRAGGSDDKALGTNTPAYGESSGGRTIPVPKPPAGAAAPAGEVKN